MNRRRITGTAISFAAALLLLPLVTRGETPAPGGGYRIVYRDTSVKGAEHMRIVRDDGPMVVNVVRVAPRSGLKVTTVLSGDRVAGGAPVYEHTTSMCQRVGCHFAVNADFANLATGEPVGGAVVAGQFVRSPVPHHQQFMVSNRGRASAGHMSWSGTVTDPGALLRPAFSLGFHGVNVARQTDQIVLYTGHWAASTGTNNAGVEILARVVEAGGPVPASHTIAIELVELRSHDTAIPPWGVVLSGTGAGARSLRDMWARRGRGELASRLQLTVHAPDAEMTSVGGYPVLVEDGRPVYLSANDGFTRSRHPRTVAGRTADGTILLVTVDGRQPCCSIGMTLPETADLMVALGAVEAINLDGGGSTTFVAHGVMVNHPSTQIVFRDGRTIVDGTPTRSDLVLAHLQRPVTTALVVVPE
ncbi:MAG TPA: phosphodiester glycosidase family protein [Acidimicrobiales bacterium]|nr:phosphodiester glycosidase family protein [Acidimicrobiales bacterium]